MKYYLYFNFDIFILKSIGKSTLRYFWFCCLVLLTIVHQLGPGIGINKPVSGC